MWRLINSKIQIIKLNCSSELTTAFKFGMSLMSLKTPFSLLNVK